MSIETRLDTGLLDTMGTERSVMEQHRCCPTFGAKVPNTGLDLTACLRRGRRCRPLAARTAAAQPHVRPTKPEQSTRYEGPPS